MSTDTELDRRIAALGALLADLDGYIDRKAAEKAAPAIAEAERAANEAIQEAVGPLRAELQRQQDLVAELRRRADYRDRQIERATQARVRIAAALSETTRTPSWLELAANVEHRLAEDAATIERLRAEKLDAITGQLVTDVPLPAMSTEGKR